MTAYALLLRGVNVGGKNRLPMQDFRAHLESLGCERVSSYIQSGNAVLEDTRSADELSALISSTMAAEFGIEPQTLLLSGEHYLEVVAANPFLEKMQDPRHVHIWFTAQSVVDADLPKLESLTANDEEFLLRQRAFYLHAPNGIGRSRLAAGVESSLGVGATARNWRTVVKLADLLAALDQA